QRTFSVIAWDLDNTLFDRDAAFASFFDSWLKVPAFRRGGLLQEIRAADCSGDGDRLAFCAKVLDYCGLPSSGAAALWEEIQRTIPAFIRLDARVAALLEQLAPHFKMAIVTNGGGMFQRAKLRHAGLEQWFPPETVFVSGELGVAKPDRAIFEALLRSTGVRPRSALMIGDHPINDIQGAAALGMQTCWVSLGRTPPNNLHADFIIDRVWDFPMPFHA
ncbi:MAG: HAD family hydrolase, partial [Verrucomicrobiota bacterium]